MAPPSKPDRPGPGPPQAGEPKTITIAARDPVRGFAPWNVGSTGGGTLSLVELHSNALVSVDAQGNLEPRLAARLPSFDDGTIVVLPDGRMRATWALRPGVRWQDGTPFTADDVVLGWQVSAHPEIPVQRSPNILQIESITAADPNTAVITWRTTYFKSFHLGARDHLPLPAHILGDAFQADRAAFQVLPYWTSDYLHLGAFRLVDFGLGENLVFHRFDDYFRGRPRVDRIVVRIIGDENAVLSNLLAGAVDIVAEGAMSEAISTRLRDQWAPSGEGKVVQRHGNWRFAAIQLNPELAQPGDLRDLRVRRALLLAIDRDALREVILPGFSDTSGDSFMPRTDPRAPLVGQPFARYRYDPATAARELAEAGWRRGVDGALSTARAEPARMALRGVGGDPQEVSVIAQDWRQLGMEIAEEQTPRALLRDPEYLATFTGAEVTALSRGDTVVRRADSRLRPTPQNRFTGTNSGHYVNPAMDGLIDRLYATISERDQAPLLREIGDIFAADLPVLPLYFGVVLASVRRGVRAFEDFAGTETPSFPSRNAHLWERD